MSQNALFDIYRRSSNLSFYSFSFKLESTCLCSIYFPIDSPLSVLRNIVEKHSRSINNHHIDVFDFVLLKLHKCLEKIYLFVKKKLIVEASYKTTLDPIKSHILIFLLTRWFRHIELREVSVP